MFLCALSALVVTLPKTHAQPHNGEIYKALLQDFLTELPPANIKFEENLKTWIPSHSSDTTSRILVRIPPPNISYKPLKKKHYSRDIEISVQVRDSLKKSQLLTYTDTLSLKQLKQVQKASPPDFRAELPTTTARIYIPFAIVAGSIGAVISLFYIRSR